MPILPSLPQNSTHDSEPVAFDSVASTPVTELTSKIQWNTIMGIILGLVCFLSIIFFLHNVQQRGMGLTWVLRIFRHDFFCSRWSTRRTAARRRRQLRDGWVASLPGTLRPTFDPIPPPYTVADPHPPPILEEEGVQNEVTTGPT